MSLLQEWLCVIGQLCDRLITFKGDLLMYAVSVVTIVYGKRTNAAHE
jgi:hypothetical protein